MGENNNQNGRRNRGRAGMILIVVAAVVLIIALYMLIPILRDYRGTTNTYQELQDDMVEFDQNTTTGDEPWNEYDWASVKIDFDSLKQINPDVVGWIRFDNTEEVNVDYPILHTSDNDTYLRTDLYGESHTAGSIFLEAANSPDFSDIYNIVYGHNMRNGTMFGTLRKYRDDEDFYAKNPYFTIYTPEGAYRYVIFGYNNIEDDSDIYQVGFVPDEQYQQLINEMISSSMYDTGIVPTISDRTMTLSTCTSEGDDYRFVVYGVCVDQKLY